MLSQLLVDTGSVVSILPESTYLEHFKNALLTEPKLHLVTSLKKPISVVGCLQVQVRRNHVSVPADFFIVPSGTPILGMDLFTALRLNIVNGCVTPASVLSTSVHQTSAWQTSHPNVTGTLGYAKGFVHRMKTRPDVVPIQQKLHRLPFAVCDAVSQEVKTLEEAGIIERIDSSE